jgi:serine/threonine-protein kinase RsbW
MASAPHNFASLKRPGPIHQGCRIDRQPTSLEATFNSDPAHLAPVRTAIESLCADTGFDAKSTGEIGLTVNEAIANVMRHAYGSAHDMPILMHAQVNDDRIEIALRDWGTGRCPSEPATRKPADALTPGGLGLVCMHKLMDEVLFTPQPHGMLLTMRRAKAGRPGAT